MSCNNCIYLKFVDYNIYNCTYWNRKLLNLDIITSDCTAKYIKEINDTSR